MANGNFIVQNGLQVGPLTIDAATGSISTTGCVTISGGLGGVTSISKNDSSISINDVGTGSNVVIVIDGATESTLTQTELTLAGNLVVNQTGYLTVPVGTSAQRPGSPTNGMMRYNSSITSFEGYYAGAWSSLGGVKSVDGKAYISAEASAGAGDDVIRVYAGDSGTSTQVAWASTSNVKVLPTTAAVSSTTGALQVAGGAGVAGAMFVGGNVVAASTTASTSASTGALVVLGGIGVAKDSVFGGNVSITGNLNITGQSVSIGSSTLSVNDPIINLNTPSDLSPLTTLTTADIGIKFHYYDTADSAAFIGRGADTGYLEWYNKGTDAGNVFTGTSYGTIKTGNVILTGSAGTAITHTGNIVPSANLTYNIGSATAWYNTFYGVSTQAKYADLAENYQADKPYNPGTVLMFGGDQEVTIATADTTAVAGVVSTNPAHLMNGQLSGGNVVALALTGRVPCNVIGPVKKGDLMVSAGFGYAKVNNSPAPGTIIGKALQDYPINGKGIIEVVVGRF